MAKQIYRIKTPAPVTFLMYGLKFEEGVAVTNDSELAERIVREFPSYRLEREETK